MAGLGSSALSGLPSSGAAGATNGDSEMCHVAQSVCGGAHHHRSSLGAAAAERKGTSCGGEPQTAAKRLGGTAFESDAMWL